MDNHEAIASLKTLCHTCDFFPKCVHEKPECFQAIELAIFALQAQDVPDINVGDMISRQKAIDALCRRCDLVSDDEPCTEECNDIKILKMLPSAQPDFNTVEKIDKAYDDGYKCGYLQAKSDYETDMRGKQDG